MTAKNEDVYDSGRQCERSLLYVISRSNSKRLQPWWVRPGAKPRRWVPLTCDIERVLSENNKDLIFCLFHPAYLLTN